MLVGSKLEVVCWIHIVNMVDDLKCLDHVPPLASGGKCWEVEDAQFIGVRPGDARDCHDDSGGEVGSSGEEAFA